MQEDIEESNTLQSNENYYKAKKHGRLQVVQSLVGGKGASRPPEVHSWVGSKDLTSPTPVNTMSLMHE